MTVESSKVDYFAPNVTPNIEFEYSEVTEIEQIGHLEVQPRHLDLKVDSGEAAELQHSSGADESGQRAKKWPSIPISSTVFQYQGRNRI